MVTVTTSELDANRGPWLSLSDAQRDEACDWLRLHGLDPMRVITSAIDCIDMPMITVGEATADYALNDAGDDLLIIKRDLPLAHPLPDWWQPDIPWLGESSER